MNRLTVFYDEQCGMCCSVREWLLRQPVYVPLEFIPLQSPMLEQRFPGLSAYAPEKEILVVSDEGGIYRGGGAWAKQVREAKPGELSDIDAIDIPTVLERAGRHRISILKIDIEGAECVLFSAPNVSDWLGKVDCIAVELHDDTHFGRCTDVFYRAIEGHVLRERIDEHERVANVRLDHGLFGPSLRQPHPSLRPFVELAGEESLGEDPAQDGGHGRRDGRRETGDGSARHCVARGSLRPSCPEL